MNSFIVSLSQAVWGVPMIVLIMGVGILLTVRLGGLQIRLLPKALKFMVSNESGGQGEVTSFAALCTALAATIGTGNIVGVATALVAGGPGALLWMIIAALLGMATQYAEGLLAVKYRSIDADGHVLGGPFYYIERGLGKGWKWLAKLFALFGSIAGLFGIGTITQVNGIASAAKSFFDPNSLHMVSVPGGEYSIATVAAAVIVAACAALVIIGGIKRIAGVAQIMVPFMAASYVIVCLIILACNASSIPSAAAEIVQSAFGLRAAAGGALGAMLVAVQKGVSRGVFTNEAGMGSAPIAAAAARTSHCARQGLVTMTGTFIDTVIICTMTGLTIVITGTWNIGLDGVDVTLEAFSRGLPFDSEVSSLLLMLSLVFFAFATILGWNYYAERCLEYLTGNKTALMAYRWLYILAVLAGPFMTVAAVWNIADVFNGLMAIPNLVAIIGLSGVVKSETEAFFKKQGADA